MKEFTDLRKQLYEGVEDLAEHIAIATSSMPPNILILRRKTVRQFPNHTMVALYYNDKLDQYFSIPYGGDASAVVTPVSLREEEQLQEVSDKVATSAFYARLGRSKYASKKGDRVTADKHMTKAMQTHERIKKKHLEEDIEELDEAGYRTNPKRAAWMSEFETHVVKQAPEHTGKIDWDSAHHMHFSGKGAKESADQYVKSRHQLPESVEHNAIDTLRSIRDFHAIKHIKHDDGTKTHVDPTTAHALLTVHDALKPEHQTKFAEHLKASKPKFNKMLDFTWKSVH